MFFYLRLATFDLVPLLQNPLNSISFFSFRSYLVSIYFHDVKHQNAVHFVITQEQASVSEKNGRYILLGQNIIFNLF